MKVRFVYVHSHSPARNTREVLIGSFCPCMWVLISTWDTKLYQAMEDWHVAECQDSSFPWNHLRAINSKQVHKPTVHIPSLWLVGLSIHMSWCHWLVLDVTVVYSHNKKIINKKLDVPYLVTVFLPFHAVLYTPKTP